MTNETRNSSTKENYPDHKTVVEFFKKLSETYEEGYLDEPCKEMIKNYPQLLDCSCPVDDGINLDDLDLAEGLTAAECMCAMRNTGYGVRDILFELVKMGAKATQECYDDILNDDEQRFPVLLYSGCLPLGKQGRCQKFILDAVADDEEFVENHDSWIDILVGNIKVGDPFSFGTINEAGVERIKKLPKLQVGLTHAKDGPFETFMKTNGYEKYLSTINGSSTNDKKTKKRKCDETQQQIKSSK